jgi:hypothetical protein
MRYTDTQIAEAIHVVNGLLQRWHAAAGVPGEEPFQPAWRDAPPKMRARVLALVRGYRNGITARQAHERWVEAMAADGWRWGLRKSEEDKTHPNMVAYSELPQEQRAKDLVSQQIVYALVAAGNGG